MTADQAILLGPSDQSVSLFRHRISHSTRTMQREYAVLSPYAHGVPPDWTGWRGRGRLRAECNGIRVTACITTGHRHSKASMRGSGLTKYPHLSWFAYGLSIEPPQAYALHDYKPVSHQLVITAEGEADLSWTMRGTVVGSHVSRGSLSFCPSGPGLHSLGITSAGGYRGYMLLIPLTQLNAVWNTEGVRHAAGLRVIPAFRDTLLLACALRLVFADTTAPLQEGIGSEIAARQLLVRLAGATGGPPPDWISDGSMFTPSVMRQILERVDARLADQPTLVDMSSGFGLSPSHFARKFQRSTGLSLNRFMNRRRIRLALALLKTGRTPLAQLSLDLGFSSQSHFTRLFSSLTGITPYQFQRSQRRMRG